MSETADSADLDESLHIRRRGTIRILLIITLLPLIGWIIMSSWLMSLYGREWVATKIQGIVSLDTRVGMISVTPWYGIRLQYLEFAQPSLLRAQVKAPLLRVDDLRITPVWNAWWHGRHDWTNVEIHRPRMVLPIELLSLLPKTERTPAGSQIEDEPLHPSILAQQNPVLQPSGPILTEKPGIGILPQELESAKKPQRPSTGAMATKKISVPKQLAPTSWVKIFDGEIIILRAEDQMILGKAKGLKGSIPVAGREASSTFRCTSLQLGDSFWKDGLSIGLDWKFPLLTQRLADFEVQGVKGRFSSCLGILRGFPAQIAVEVLPQEVAGLEILGGCWMKASEVQTRLAFRGFLPAPGSWQADWMAELRNVEGKISGHHVRFDRGGAVAVLRGGILSCLDARLIGDDLSLLGNASLLADGRGAGVMRVVAAPETLAGVAGRLFPAGSEIGLTPLSTPQRAALDIEANGTFPKFHVQARGRDR